MKKIYKTQEEVDKDVKDGILKINKDVRFECPISIRASIIVDGDLVADDIITKNIVVKGDLTAKNIIALDINAENIVVKRDFTAKNIIAWSIDAKNILYYAFCCVYGSIRCKSIKGIGKNHAEPICLDGKLEIKK